MVSTTLAICFSFFGIFFKNEKNSPKFVSSHYTRIHITRYYLFICAKIMHLIIYKLIICLLSTYRHLLVLFPSNSQFFNVSNFILLNNYMMYMKKIFSYKSYPWRLLSCSYIDDYKNMIRYKNMAYMNVLQKNG
jgi:hypothetical protein